MNIGPGRLFGRGAAEVGLRGADWLRVAGALLVGYGAVGLLILSVGALSVGQPFTEVEALSDAVAKQREALVATLDRTGATLDDAGGAFGNFDASLRQSQQSAGRAAGLTRAMSTTMTGLARATEVQVLGQQPLAGLAPSFDQAAGQLTELGGDLDGIATALGRNAGDLQTTRENIAALRAQLARLRDAVQATPGFEATRTVIGTLRVVLYLVIAWLTLLAASSLVLGVALLRASRR